MVTLLGANPERESSSSTAARGRCRRPALGPARLLCYSSAPATPARSGIENPPVKLYNTAFYTSGPGCSTRVSRMFSEKRQWWEGR